MAKLWGGRFSKETSKLVDQFNASIGFDSRLWEHDIQGSIAHARMLGKCGIIPEADADKIVDGLKQIAMECASDVEKEVRGIEIAAEIRQLRDSAKTDADYEEVLRKTGELKRLFTIQSGLSADDFGAGKVEFDISAEDIHMNIEKLLHERIGEVAGRLHTARSRNDQIALDLRMYLKSQIKQIVGTIKDLQTALIACAEQNVDTIMPGYTHMQHAQPVTLAHHLMAYVWMFQRDVERFADCYKRTDVMPLGSAAMAGTSYPIDRQFVADQLGFSRISDNSMDAVADRDFAAEFLASAAILSMHMSRFAEEIIIWNTREFGFVELDDSMATGSSIMPQKKNPDVAELIKGKTGRVYGDLTSLLTVLKGLPLTYNKDLQEDKEPVFDAVDTVLQCVPMLQTLIETTDFRSEAMSCSSQGDFSTATDVADYLVRHGVPFRQAHEIVGRMVQYCIGQGKTLEDLTLDEMKSFSGEFEESGEAFTIKRSVEARDVPGGTASGQVRKQIESAKQSVAAKVIG